MSLFTFEIATDLAADAQTILDHASRMTGVNEELGPFLRMTAPSELDGRSIFEAEPKTKLFRSWVLLFGILPIDFDDLTLEEIDPLSGFVEQSTMGTMRSWRHERRVVARRNGGARISDRLTFAPRVRWTGPFLQRIVEALFAHRHRRLVTRYGAIDTSSSPSIAQA